MHKKRLRILLKIHIYCIDMVKMWWYNVFQNQPNAVKWNSKQPLPFREMPGGARHQAALLNVATERLCRNRRQVSADGCSRNRVMACQRSKCIPFSG